MRPEFELLESRTVMSKNIVLIVVDDMRYDLLDYMPRTERIIRGDGTEFVNAYVTTPSCCPSRASILTGEYASSHGVINNHSAALFNEFQALPVWLDDAGYQTGFYGKYLNTYDGSFVPPGWGMAGIATASPAAVAFNANARPSMIAPGSMARVAWLKS